MARAKLPAGPAARPGVGIEPQAKRPSAQEGGKPKPAAVALRAPAVKRRPAAAAATPPAGRRRRLDKNGSKSSHHISSSSKGLLNPAASSTRKVLVLYTGGTFGMLPLEDGSLGISSKHEPLLDRLKKIEELQQSRMPQCSFVSFTPLMDSADMSPNEWNMIAKAVVDHYPDYDGFVIIHGTDTMAYTASALSFMLEQLSKPVILTGSQLPLFEPLSDARQNFLGAVVFAGLADVCEVCVFFCGLLFRGNRVSKCNATQLRAFDSACYPPLAQQGVSINVYSRRLRMPPRGRFRLQAITESDVMVVWVIPGFSDGSFLPLLQSKTLKGMVLLLYGCGNAPSRKEGFLSIIQRLVRRGVVVCAISQCAVGNVSLSKYAVGKAFNDAGVVSCGDMTTEAAVTKLAYLFSKGLCPAEVRAKMQEDLRGEVTTTMTTLEIKEPTSGLSSL